MQLIVASFVMHCDPCTIFCLLGSAVSKLLGSFTSAVNQSMLMLAPIQVGLRVMPGARPAVDQQMGKDPIVSPFDPSVDVSSLW